ncbi:MAG: radical SAM protein [Clostridia bacterium]|nr:radical SAM protein [Clostridia bacterium]
MGATTINKLYIEPSSLCNLQCNICFRNNWIGEKQGLMDEACFENLYKALAVSAPANVVLGGMGEPLTHPRIAQWTRKLKSLGCRVEVITNAVLLTEAMSRELIDAGIDEVWISMEGFSREAYEKERRGAAYDDLIRNIEAFNRARGAATDVMLGVTFVMIAENTRELTRINRFAQVYKVDEINLSFAIPSSPVERENTIYRDGYPVGRMREWAPNFTPVRDTYCRFVAEDNAFVRWDGAVAPCMQLLHECHTYLYTEKRRIRRISFGNVNNSDIHEIWQSDAYTAFRKRICEFDFPCCTSCDGCDDRLCNEKDCCYNDFPTCGACLWGRGLVYCP